MSGLLWDFMFLALVLACLHGWKESIQEGCGGSLPEMLQGAGSAKGWCIPKGQDPYLEEKAVCNSISVGTFLIHQLFLYSKVEFPCKGNNPSRVCMSASCVVKLYLSMGLALLFVFESKPHHCCYVGWMWSRLFCKWSYFPSYLSSTEVFPCFPWKYTDCPLSPSPFLSCSSSHLCMSQDTIPLRIHFI